MSTCLHGGYVRVAGGIPKLAKVTVISFSRYMSATTEVRSAGQRFASSSAAGLVGRAAQIRQAAEYELKKPSS